MANEFQEMREMEQKQADLGNLPFLIELAKGLTEMVKELKKEVRKVREDLRNLERLRPLRDEVEAEQIEQ